MSLARGFDLRRKSSPDGHVVDGVRRIKTDKSAFVL